MPVATFAAVSAPRFGRRVIVPRHPAGGAHAGVAAQRPGSRADNLGLSRDRCSLSWPYRNARCGHGNDRDRTCLGAATFEWALH